jgi:hypothetical protein
MAFEQGRAQVETVIDNGLLQLRRTGFHRTLRYTLSPAGLLDASNCSCMSKVSDSDGPIRGRGRAGCRPSHTSTHSLSHTHALPSSVNLQVLLVQALPREVFVDPYQIEDACRLHRAFSFELLGPVELEL